MKNEPPLDDFLSDLNDGPLNGVFEAFKQKQKDVLDKEKEPEWPNVRVKR